VIFRELPENRSAAQAEETDAPQQLVRQGFELWIDSIDQKSIHINISLCHRPEKSLRNYRVTSSLVMYSLTVISSRCFITHAWKFAVTLIFVSKFHVWDTLEQRQVKNDTYMKSCVIKRDDSGFGFRFLRFKIENTSLSPKTCPRNFLRFLARQAGV
jgi:hypothetical protein